VLAIYPLSDGYRFLGLLHIAAVIAAFGPLLVYPTLRASGDSARLARLYLYLSFPALTLVWVLGMGMVGVSDKVVEMSETWIVLSIVGWVILMAIGWFLIRPAITDRSQGADKRFSAGVGATHLLMIVILILMVFKPGSGT
jgi:uncharacterized membrane protein